MSDSTSRPLRVFLCHASGDKPAVQKLYSRLIRDGIDAWLDKENLIPGQNWQIEIPKAVRNSDVVLVCLSSQSVNKEGFVQKEIRIALDAADEKPEGTIFIIPVRLEECKVPERISQYHWVDIFSDNGYERLWKALRLRANTVGTSFGPISPGSAVHEDVSQGSKVSEFEYKTDRIQEPSKRKSITSLTRQIADLENYRKRLKNPTPIIVAIGITVMWYIIFSAMIASASAVMFNTDDSMAQMIGVTFAVFPTFWAVTKVLKDRKKKHEETLKQIGKEIQDLKSRLQSLQQE
jgi:hypothetical protein